MTANIFKAIGIGILAGALLFFIPFPFRFFFIFFLIFFAFRFFAFGRWRRRYWNDENFNRYHFWNPSYTQKWRSMNDDERKSFIQKMENELFKTNLSTEQ